MQRDPWPDLPLDLQRVLDDLARLRTRLLRMTSAVATSSRAAVEALEESAAGPHDERLLLAQRLRADADLCVEFEHRLREA